MSKLTLSLTVLLCLLMVGCDQPSQTVIAPTAALTFTPTPPSTVLAAASLTPTPFGATPLPTATPSPIPSATIPPCTETAGQIVTQTLFSAAVNHEVRYQVYLPPCYSTSARRYPVLYMLHGYGEGMDDMQWSRLGLTQQADAGFADGSLPPLIIVMPNGNDANHNWDTDPFPTMVADELVPTVDTAFCTWNDVEKRAVGGLSRGGYWAYWLAFDNPDVFGRVGGHSPYLYDPQFATDANPFNLVDTADLTSLQMYIDHGGEGREVLEVAPPVQRLLARLSARGYSPQYVPNATGDHVDAYWSAHIPEYLAFYTADWPRDVSQYPACP